MSEEEKKDLEYIKESPTSREIMLLRIISKLQSDIELKDKVIDELINFLLNYDIDEDYCKKIERQECNKYKEGYCDKCIKQHFYKKVEEEKC